MQCKTQLLYICRCDERL